VGGRPFARRGAAGSPANRRIEGDPVTFGESLQPALPAQRPTRPEGPLDPLGLVGRFEAERQHRSPIGHVPAERRDLGQPVGAAAEMSPGARPGPRAGLFDPARGDRIVLDVARGDHQMRVVHRIAPETPLEEVAAGIAGAVHALSISGMDTASGARRPSATAGRRMRWT
jgi:hypothetical protein